MKQEKVSYKNFKRSLHEMKRATIKMLQTQRKNETQRKRIEEDSEVELEED